MFVLQCISCLLQTVYDQHFITLFNIVYTSLPVLAMGIFDQVCVKYLCLLGVFEFKTETVAPEIIAFPRTLRTQSQQTEIKTTRNCSLRWSGKTNPVSHNEGQKVSSRDDGARLSLQMYT